MAIVSRVTEIPPSPTIFDLQSVASTYNIYQGFGLIKDGCQGGCSETCSNVEDIFAKATSLQNCLSYPTILKHIESDEATESDKDIASRYAIKSSPNVTSQTITSCLGGYIEWCKYDSFCRQYHLDVKATCEPVLSLNKSSTFVLSGLKEEPAAPSIADCLLSVCSSVDTSVSTDIDGAGVRISYYMQIVVSLLIFILITFWEHVPYHLSLAFLARRHGAGAARLKARKIHKDQKRHIEALVTAAIEFHKAQCYFMSAIQVAAIVVMNTGILESNSLGQVLNSFELIKTLCSGSSLPIALVLYRLWAVKKLSWELWILSAITIVLCIGTYFNATGTSPGYQIKPLHIDTHLYPGCGNAKPTTYCTSPASTKHPNTLLGPEFAIIFSVILLTIIFVDLIRNTRRSRRNPDNHPPDHLKSTHNVFKPLLFPFPSSAHPPTPSIPTDPHPPKPLPPTFKIPKPLRHHLLTTLTLSLLLLYTLFIHAFITSLRRFNNPLQTDLRKWTIGQIIAIMVFLPPIQSYLTFEIRGLQKAHESRLPRNWKLVRTATEASGVGGSRAGGIGVGGSGGGSGSGGGGSAWGGSTRVDTDLSWRSGNSAAGLRRAFTPKRADTGLEWEDLAMGRAIRKPGAVGVARTW